jgi:uncharacterized membrane protein
MLVLAAVYLGFMRLPQTAVASAIHLSIAVVFLTVAIPLKASGHWITASWLVEGLVLMWVASRLGAGATGDEPGEDSELYASGTLRWLGSASLALGFCGVFIHLMDSRWAQQPSLFNSDTGTAVIGIAAFAGAAWLALDGSDDTRMRTLSWPTVAVTGFLAVGAIAVLLTAREWLFSWGMTEPHPPFQTADFATAMGGLAVFAGGA